MDFRNHLQGGECVTESKNDGLDGRGYRQFAHALQNIFFYHGDDKFKKKNGKVKRGGEHAFFKKVQREGHVII